MLGFVFGSYRSVDAIGRFAGPREARGFVRFAAHAARVYRTLENSFIRAPRPTPFDLIRRVGIAGLTDLWNMQPFVSLWRTMKHYFSDPRLRQLFGRYATYCGSSPFASPATLMLVAHVERAGVWYVDGGMQRLAVQLAALAANQGASMRYGTGVARITQERPRARSKRTAVNVSASMRWYAMRTTMPWPRDFWVATSAARCGRPCRRHAPCRLLRGIFTLEPPGSSSPIIRCFSAATIVPNSTISSAAAACPPHRRFMCAPKIVTNRRPARANQSGCSVW